MDPLDNETCCACLLTTKASTMYWLGDPDTLKLFQDSTNISIPENDHNLTQYLCALCYKQCDLWQCFKARCKQRFKECSSGLPLPDQDDTQMNIEPVKEEAPEEQFDSDDDLLEEEDVGKMVSSSRQITYPEPPVHPMGHLSSTSPAPTITQAWNYDDMKVLVQNCVQEALKPYMEKIGNTVGELLKTADELTKEAANTLLAHNLETKKPPTEPLLVLPMNPERMVAMEKASSNSKLRTEFITELQRATVHSFTNIFTEETQRFYNWTGKAKKPIKTNEVFLLVQKFWFHNDAELMKLKVKDHWEKLTQKTIKKRNRDNITRQRFTGEGADQGQLEQMDLFVIPNSPDKVAAERGELSIGGEG